MNLWSYWKWSDAIEHFNDSFQLAFQKLSKHVDGSEAMGYFKLCRIFDPRVLPRIPTDINHYCQLRGFENPDNELMTEWQIYIATREIPEDIELDQFWQSMAHPTPKMTAIAMDHIWSRTTSVDCERSFSQYNNLLTDCCERLTELHTKQLLMLRFNGDIEGRMEQDQDLE